MRREILFITTLIILFTGCREEEQPVVTLLSTTDIHGAFFPYDFINDRETSNSLANVSEYVNRLRDSGRSVILLDNGDILQGQPEVYYYNYVDTVTEHLCASILNYMGFDAATVGNHDIEAGPAVYEKLREQYNFPMLAANIVDADGNCWFEPYTIIERNGLRIAIMGLITTSVPDWLPPSLYEGMYFENMTTTAALRMEEIMAEEPDLVVGLFHSGWGRGGENPPPGNSTSAVAWHVPGFDIIFAGHDHSTANMRYINSAGDTVVILNAGARASHVARADIYSVSDAEGEVKSHFRIESSLDAISPYPADATFIERFSEQFYTVKGWVNRVIGYSPATISTRGALFGQSEFMNIIHDVQLEISGTDISFAAPLSFNAAIDSGELRRGDMFKLYRFENMLYTMEMSGEEVKGFLESSYGRWFNTVSDTGDYILNYRTDSEGNVVLRGGRARVREQVYNFDSAAGIKYTVNVTAEPGSRINILSLIDGTPFSADSLYRVAINSYRASGGGRHIRDGAGLTPDQVQSRIISVSERDLRHHITRWVEERGTIASSRPLEWRVIPEQYLRSAVEREYPLLYGYMPENITIW